MTSIPPIYDRDGITIYNADCRDVLPHIDPSSVGLLLTDPPYGIAYEGVSTGGYAAVSKSAGRVVAGDDREFDPAHLLPFPKLVLFGANHYAHRLPPGGWIVWDKTGGDKARSFMGDAELAWTNTGRTISVYHYLWLGAFRDGEKHTHGLHPTQKPVALMAWILEKWTKPGDLILDPYMGSGPIAAAAYQLGRRYIGIELVPEYCQVAINRLAQPVLFAAS